MTYLVYPSIFSIGNDEYRIESLRFLDEIQRRVSTREMLILDFSQTQVAYAESTLMLFAIIFSIYRRYGKNCIKFIYPKQTDNRSGYDYFISTRLNIALDACTDEEITMLTTENNFYQSGFIDSADSMRISIWEDISREEISDEQKYLLQQGISEAILNIRTHAYLKKRAFANKIGKGRWWQCSWYQQSKRRFVFLIYDMGNGILGSYAKSDDPRSKEEILKEAMTTGFSRYVNKKRGKGTEDIKRVINHSQAVENENVTVYTDNLIYQYYYENGKDTVHCVELASKQTVTGTLVSWSLTLSDKDSNDGR